MAQVPADLAGYTEVFEEPLVGRPELSPHRLLHLLLCVDEVGGLGELVEQLHPEVDGPVVDGPQGLTELHLVDTERDTLK